MENSDGAGLHERDSSQCVRVAVNIRPLITPELLNGCTDCITVIPGEPQVQIGSHAFTYDHVYGNRGSPSSSIFDDCVAPLVEALFHGYNATLLAYGQTGSGKTYTMGTNYNGEESSGGIIPKVMETIFHRVETMKDSMEFLIRVSFIEIFKEEVLDLLDSSSSISKGERVSSTKTVGAGRAPIQIRETVTGGITLAGVTEAEVRSKEEMASYLLRGSLARATGSTNMKSQSSRSHAVFTISMEQKKNLGNILCSKLNLVDLAGSERAKRIGADGMRLKEGIYINKGLLALGNVLSALGDKRKRKEGTHVPYRDSKLTRLLQDSLGGNSKTVMIACVSPADTNAEETLNTLKYADRARNIQNKAAINRNPVADQLQRMRSQIEQLQAELLFYRGDINAPFDDGLNVTNESESFRSWKAAREKEVLQAIEHELEVTVQVHEVRSAYERQMEEAKMAKEIARLKEEEQMQRQAMMSACPQGLSPIARNSRICHLENMLSTSSSTLVSMASQLLEAEEREKVFTGRGRWNQVCSLAEAKSLMNHLFNIASSSRCQVQDKEVDCREKDSEIQDLKEKLTTVTRQMEMQKAELIQQVKSQSPCSATE